jgi:hypothetical protein
MKNILSIYVFILLFGCSFVIAQQKIYNGDFNKKTASWSIETHNGTTATFDIDSSGLLEGIACAHIYITNSNGTDWNLQFQQIIGVISAGDDYRISFEACASTPATISYWIQQYHDSYSILFQKSIDLTVNKQTFQDSIHVDSSDTNVKFAFVIGALSTGSELWFDTVSMIKTNPTSVELNQSGIVPNNFGVMQNYPNPFNPSTTIPFSLPSTSFVSLKIFDVLGKEVATLVNEVKSAGIYKTQWNADHMPSGIYFYRLQAGSFTETKKLVLLK